MIKGVNKKVLEINNPQSLYFEKAVFYLKPNMGSVPEKLVKREAQSYLMSISPKSPKYVAFLKRILLTVLILTAILGIGIALFSIIR